MCGCTRWADYKHEPLLMKISLTIKIISVVLLVSIFVFPPLAYLNIQQSREIVEAAFVEKAKTIARVLDASIGSEEELTDSTRLFDTLQNLIWLHPDMLSIDINVPRDNSLFTYVSTSGRGVGEAADADNIESYRNDILIHKIVERRGRDVMTVITPIHFAKQQAGTYEIELTLEAVNVEIASAIKLLIVVYLVMMLSFALLLFWILRMIVIKPVDEIGKGVEQIAKGAMDYRIDIMSRDELGSLAAAFNEMGVELGRSKGELTRLNEVLETRVRERTNQLSAEISERTEAEKQMRLAKEHAETASRVKSDFLSSMSHELRTPLNAIMGFAQLLEIDDRPPLTDAQKTCIGHIIQSGAHLLELINDVLELERVEAGKLELAIEDVAPRLVVDDCIVLTEALARSRGVVVDDRSAGRTLPCVRADFVRFKQVLVNLLSNAVKYNREGGRVFVDCTEGDDSMIRVSVEDTGIGIPEERRSEVFERFARLGQGTEPVEGTGIGLAVSKQLVDLMDGSIGFKSMLGAGSTFWVELPAAKRGSDAEPRRAMPKRARG